MKRYFIGITCMALGAIGAIAQNGENHSPQIHGFVTQSFVYSTDNNYLGMNTTSGTLAWTEAAININEQVNSKLRAGAQLHYTRLGAFDGNSASVDWAQGDCKINHAFEVRAGKLKIPWGLFNDTQDYDPGYMWSLLPETIYGVDYRATDLSQLGMDVSGRVSLGERMGKLDYSAYYGYYSEAANDGIMEGFKESGLTFTNPPGGKTPGFDLRWQTPVRDLIIGGSVMTYNAKGNLTDGKYVQPLAYWPAYYAQYEYKGMFASFQYTKLIQYQTVKINGFAPATTGIDTPAWFAMGGYHLTEKLQVGAYYTNYVSVMGVDRHDPANYFSDWVVSGRYDINSHSYAKLEGHFIDGDGIGYYGFDNANGLKPRSDVVVAKIGFTF